MSQTGAAWAAGIANALQGLQQGAQQRQDRQQQKMINLAHVQAEEYGSLYARAQAAPTQENWNATKPAYDAYMKTLKDLEKSLGGGDKTVWNRIKSQLVGVAQQYGASKRRAPQGPTPAPSLVGGPVAAGPVAPPNQAPVPSFEELMSSQGQLSQNLQRATNEKQLFETQQGLQGEQTQVAGKKKEAEAWESVTGPNKTSTPGEALKKYMDGAAQAGESPFQAGMDFIDHGVSAGFFQMTPELQQAYDRLKTRTTKPVPPKYMTGQAATIAIGSGVGEKPIDQYTPEDWKAMAAFSKQQRDQLAQARAAKDKAAAAFHGSAHLYQQFQARTTADRIALSRYQSRIGQIEALLGNVMNTLTPDDRAARLKELDDLQNQVKERNATIDRVYDDIYKGKPEGSAATPTPAPEVVGEAGPSASSEPKPSSQFASGLDQF